MWCGFVLGSCLCFDMSTLLGDMIPISPIVVGPGVAEPRLVEARRVYNATGCAFLDFRSLLPDAQRITAAVTLDTYIQKQVRSDSGCPRIYNVSPDADCYTIQKEELRGRIADASNDLDLPLLPLVKASAAPAGSAGHPLPLETSNHKASSKSRSYLK